MKYLMLAAVFLGGLFMFMHSSNAKELMSYSELQQKVANKENIIVLDVRSEEEYKAGHIPTAILLPHDQLEINAEQLFFDKKQEIIVYCRSGRRSNIAHEMLIKLGYTNVKDFGGISRWEGILES